jgi:hypothetical protein
MSQFDNEKLIIPLDYQQSNPTHTSIGDKLTWGLNDLYSVTLLFTLAIELGLMSQFDNEKLIIPLDYQQQTNSIFQYKPN